MAGGDYRTNLGINTSQYDSGLESSKQKTKQFQEEADKTSKTVEALGKKSKSAADLLKQIGDVEGQVRSISNYRSQMNKMVKEIQDLTINYRNMSKEMQNSDLGREMLANIQALTVKAAEYKDAIGDAQESVKALASDTSGWDAMKQGINVASSALQGFVSLGVLGEESTEKLVAVIANLKAVESATNAVIQIGNALQKNSALLMGVSAIQTKALAKAKELEAVATGKATIAQKLFNAVAAMNPYVLLATAILVAVGAIAAFTLGTNKAKKAEEEAQKAHEDYMSSMEDSISKMADAAYSFDTLRKRYLECRTEGEKQQFLKDYKSKLDDLGISVNDLNGLENVFVNNTENFRKACILRAQAMGLESMQADEYKKVMADLMKAQDLAAGVKPGARINEGDPLFDLLKEYNVGQYVARWYKDYINATDDVYADLQAAIRAGGKKSSDQIAAEQDRLRDEVDKLDLGDAFNFSGKGNSGTTTPNKPTSGSGGPKIKPDAGSLKAAQEVVRQLQEKVDNMDINVPDFSQWKQKLDEAKAEVERIQKAINETSHQPIDPPDFGVWTNKLDEAQQKVESLRESLSDPFATYSDDELKTMASDLEVAQAEVQRLTKLVNEIRFNPTGEILPKNSLKEANHFVQVFQTKLNELDPDTQEFKEVLEILNQWKERVEEINRASKPVEIFEPGSLAEATHFVQLFQEQLNNLNPDTDEFEEISDLLSVWLRKQKEINAEIDKTQDKVKTVVEQYQDITSEASDISLRYNIGEIDKAEADRQIAELNKRLEGLGLNIKVELDEKTVLDQYRDITSKASEINEQVKLGVLDPDEAQKQIDELNKQLSELGVKIPVELDETSFSQAATKIEQFVNSMDTLGSLSNAVTAIDSVVDALTGFQDKLGEAENGWEEFIVYFETAMAIFNGITTVIETVGTVMTILDAITKQLNKTTQQKAVTDLQAAGAAETKAGADLTAAGAAGALAAAEGGESVAKIPYVGAFMAVAMIATIAATIAGIISSLGAFANGGIVGGTSYSGDKVLARVNSGEMILSDAQQSKLWKMINSNSTPSAPYGGDVRFVLEGDQLIGLIDNYTSMQNKI